MITPPRPFLLSGWDQTQPRAQKTPPQPFSSRPRLVAGAAPRRQEQPFCSSPALGNGSAAGTAGPEERPEPGVRECGPSAVRADSRPAPSPPERLPENRLRLFSASLPFLVLSSEPMGRPRASSPERSRGGANLT